MVFCILHFLLSFYFYLILNSSEMFHTIITLAYTIPNIYVFLRIWQLFINKGSKVHYTLIYFLLASIYPVSNFIFEDNSGIPGGFLISAANYILPFYLYLFLSVLILDIFLLANRLFKIIPAEKFRNTRFKVYCLSFMLILSAGVVIAGIINFNTIRTSEYQIGIPRKSSKISHLKIAYVADFHLNKGTGINFVKRFAGRIKVISPDLMIFGGDIVEGDRKDENL